jgi:hypothetical protein
MRNECASACCRAPARGRGSPGVRPRRELRPPASRTSRSHSQWITNAGTHHATSADLRQPIRLPAAAEGRGGTCRPLGHRIASAFLQVGNRGIAVSGRGRLVNPRGPGRGPKPRGDRLGGLTSQAGQARPPGARPRYLRGARAASPCGGARPRTTRIGRDTQSLRCRRESSSAESSMGSAWRCTIFHSPFSRRKIVVLRSL